DLLLFTNPVIAIVPRILVGLVAGYVYQILKRTAVKDTFAMIISAILGSLTNTILVLTFIYIFYRQEYAAFVQVDVGSLLVVLGTVVITSGLAEAIAAAVIVPLVAKPLKHFVLK
ncbi:MAG: ECF transporter S component, partial [Carnobacterium sp.]